MDVITEMAGFLEIFLQHAAVDIPDGNNAGDDSIIQNGQMTNSPIHE